MRSNKTELHLSACVMPRDPKARSSYTPLRSPRAPSLIPKCVCGKHELDCLFGARCISALNALEVVWGPALKSDHLLRLDTLEILSHQELGAVHLLLVDVVKSWGGKTGLGQQPESHKHFGNSKWLHCVFILHLRRKVWRYEDAIWNYSVAGCDELASSVPYTALMRQRIIIAYNSFMQTFAWVVAILIDKGD